MSGTHHTALIAALGILTLVSSAQALEIALTSSGRLSIGIPITITDRNGNPATGKSIGDTDLALLYSCNGSTPVAFNKAGDTAPELSDGHYIWLSDDVVSGNCTPTAEGSMIMTIWFSGTRYVVPPWAINIVSAAPKVTVAGYVSPWVGKAYCDLSAASTGSSFTLASPCVSAAGNALSLATGKFEGVVLRAVTKGATACNVEDEWVAISDVTSGGVVTVLTSDISGGAFTSPPSVANCRLVVN